MCIHCNYAVIICTRKTVSQALNHSESEAKYGQVGNRFSGKGGQISQIVTIMVIML